LLGMDQAALAAAANVSRNTIVSFESGQRIPGANNLAAIQRALETAGVIFVAENGGGSGVRLTVFKECANKLLGLAQSGDADVALEAAKNLVRDYSVRGGLGLRQTADRVMLLYRDDPRSRFCAGEAIFKWMEAETVGSLRGE
jgi:transcriptional regulator with XRE-family HTH domain